MDTNKAAYWIALGVLALGLTSEYRQGNFVAVHQVAERADSVLCQIAARAEQTLAAVTATGLPRVAMSDRLALASRLDNVQAQGDLLRERARDEAELVRDEIRARADVIRAQAEMRRAEMEQVRWRMRAVTVTGAANRGLTVVCPKMGARIVVDRPNLDRPDLDRRDLGRPDLAELLPEVEVGDWF